jgi:cell wall-associated NlpC family hydrolase
MQMMTISGSLRRVGAGALLALAVAAPLRAQTAEPAETAAAASTSPSSATSSPASAWSWTAASADFAMQALSHLGVPYRFGGNDPKAGFDCSGLVRFVARSVLGIDLPRTSDAMARVGASVARDALQVGDLVFFNTRGGANSHVGIYVGEGRFVHAPSRLGKVRVEEVDATYWRARFNGARRLLMPEAAPESAVR